MKIKKSGINYTNTTSDKTHINKSKNKINQEKYFQKVGKQDKINNAESNNIDLSLEKAVESLAVKLDKGEIAPEKALELLVDGLVKGSGLPETKEFRSFLIEQIRTDPGLSKLARQIGLDPKNIS
ncbi:MAG: hypothetical protein PF689_06990 [Deltaproteobacteria bacterium]|jgi:hypothetical protein|nr:hypothetical protein [Deltaproteobacteria bacterium]